MSLKEHCINAHVTGCLAEMAALPPSDHLLGRLQMELAHMPGSSFCTVSVVSTCVLRPMGSM